MMANGQEVRRRRYSKKLKQQVLSECERPNASVAKVAMAHGINANVVHSWPKRVREALETPDAIAPQEPTFVPMMLPPAAPAPVTPQDIRVEVHRAGMTMTVSWPINAASDCAAWMREILR